MDLLIDQIDSPIGTIRLVSDGLFLRALDFGDYEERMTTLLRRHYGTCRLTRTVDAGGFTSRLRAYLAGDLEAIDGIPVKTAGTDFQRAVWAALRTIPAGATASYGEIAERIGRPRAVRAVGLANGSNPVAIVVPCHRVIGSDGSLTGYGGGLPRKRWLLEHEGAILRLRRSAEVAA